MEVELTPSLDNTMFKDIEFSNGLGEYFFAGTTSKDVKKRALVKFDLFESVPEGVTVDSAMIILTVTKVKPGSTTVKIHRLTTEWGEGSSKAEDGDGKGAPASAGDATWDFAKFPSDPWVKKGGDYDIESSGSTTVSVGSDAVFSSERLTLDVNFWLLDSSKNYGWIFIGDESQTKTSVKFASKDHNESNIWPVLKLYYQGSTSTQDQSSSRSKLSVYQGSAISNIRIINNGDPGNSLIDIYSVTGSRVFSTQVELSKGENNLSTGIQESGVYIYRILLNGIPVSGKLLISEY